MNKLLDIEIKVRPKDIHNQKYLNSLVLKKVKVDHSRVTKIKLDRRSIDARGRHPLYYLRYKVYLDNYPVEDQYEYRPKPINDKSPTCIIIGAGPAGYFAALRLLEHGIKPIVLERGKDVRARRRDLRSIQQFGEVNPHSNYCFGEGGAGTYSDGKLYTRSHKRGNIKSTLELLVAHGAQEDILIDTHPHIGSNKLPKIVSNLRTTIEENGGLVFFNHFVIDFIITNNKVTGVQVEGEGIFNSNAVILATGHSARSIYRLLEKHQITIEAKSFALGLRIEHSQAYIDSMQYNQAQREKDLPAASYSLACQVDDKGVFSFCMCPGGLVVPASTAPGEIVVNGMSMSRRDSAYANSGFVTSIDTDELDSYGYSGVFGALKFQKEVEKAMFKAGDGSQKAPAQRVKDFVDGVISPTLNPTSYIPGLISAPLHKILPSFVYHRLRQGLITFNKRMKGYVTNEANIIGTESRTSAPVKIPRNKESFMHEDLEALFPCGEGAGYAGGILSAAMDGQNVANAVNKYLITFNG